MSEDREDLEKLYVDQEDVNRKRILETLQGVVAIDSETGEMVPMAGFKNLSSRKKFVTYLLYRRAAKILGEISEEELGAESKEIAAIVNGNASTIRAYASDMDYVETDKKNGGYFIPSQYIPDACDDIPEEV
ncbi:hypothetical protein [Halorubrum sp. CBA1229]|uniref:hypothetical protein n=1 Tax=Halorubrum sp. CBA1229 TaxID=1853699 RepID=UPI0011CDB095|nr:hypothetical protein [Halorubrum sp. CBA1229]QKY18639.1 hypothetical protein Hrr1229_017160 [Halorubrum sp. CBA1229]